MTVSNSKSVALVLSELMLNVMGSRKEHGNPEIHSIQLNDELDRHYHEALAAILALVEQEIAEARKDEWDFAGDVIEAANQYALDKYIEMKNERLEALKGETNGKTN